MDSKELNAARRLAEKLDNRYEEFLYAHKLMAYLNRTEMMIMMATPGGRMTGLITHGLDISEDGNITGLRCYRYMLSRGVIDKSWIHLGWALDNLEENLQLVRKMKGIYGDHGVGEMIRWVRKQKAGSRM